MRKQIRECVFGFLAEGLSELGFRQSKLAIRRNENGFAAVSKGGELFCREVKANLIYLLYLVPDGVSDAITGYIGWSSSCEIPAIEGVFDLPTEAGSEFQRDGYITKLFETISDNGARLSRGRPEGDEWVLVPIREVKFAETERCFQEILQAQLEAFAKAASVNPDSDEGRKLCRVMADTIVFDISVYGLPYLEKIEGWS